jgi:hypothetical protein
MTEIVKETLTTQGNNINPVVNTTTKNTSVKSTVTSLQTVEYLIYFIFGALEIALILRLVFKLAGASLSSLFIRLIYGATGIFLLPFEGIFRKAFTQGAETTSVFEPSTLIALAIYAIIAWGIVKLMQVLSGEQQAN